MTRPTRKPKRRYVIYDKLEELDETHPWATVVWEPEEEYEVVEDVPITERYPWVDELGPISEKRYEEESGQGKMEPYFGRLDGWGMPQQGFRQQFAYICGMQFEHYPPWLNRPRIKPHIPDTPWRTDRRPLLEHYTPKQLKEMEQKYPEQLEALKNRTKVHWDFEYEKNYNDRYTRFKRFGGGAPRS